MSLLEGTDIARAQCRRPAGLVPVRRGQPHHVCRSRCLGRRSGFRARCRRQGLLTRRLRGASPRPDRQAAPVLRRCPARRPGRRRRASMRRQEAGGTSHFVIVDARGNAVSMTTTVESFFGNGPHGVRLLPQQPDDRLLVPARGTERRCSGQASAFVDVADDHPGPAGPPARRAGITGRQCDPGLRGQVAGRRPRLGTADAAGHRPAEPGGARIAVQRRDQQDAGGAGRVAWRIAA